LSIANAAVIEIEVAKDLRGNFTSFSYDSSNDIVKFQFEFYNTGSIPYKTRIRIDINDSKNNFVGWSDEKSLMPGDRKNFDIFWYTNSSGNFFVRTRAYYANEIFEQKSILEKNTSFFPENIFEITDFRTYDNFIIFDLKSQKDAKNVVVIPDNFPVGWIFEQKKIDFLGKYSSKTVILPYNPTLWSSQNLTLEIASDNGKYFMQKNFELSKEHGIIGFIYYCIDHLRLFNSQ
jgi:hypothetical protein